MADRMRTALWENGRWILAALAAATIALLAATVETGKARAANTSFTFLGALTNVVTPNGDRLNDVAILCYDNPRSSDVSGTIYDVRGNKVAGMTVSGADFANCPGGLAVSTGKLFWDARSGGRAVPSGIYIYQVQSEGSTITGTVMVVR